MSPKTAAARPAPLTSTDYLKQVLTARVYDVAVESDLDPARHLGRRLRRDEPLEPSDLPRLRLGARLRADQIRRRMRRLG